MGSARTGLHSIDDCGSECLMGSDARVDVLVERYRGPWIVGVESRLL